jgi:RHS repeat-associated protein
VWQTRCRQECRRGKRECLRHSEDYAMNRYYAPQWGRFTIPDPYQASAQLANPQSWNRYSYVENDPVNHNDSTGLNMDKVVPNEVGIGGVWFFTIIQGPSVPERPPTYYIGPVFFAGSGTGGTGGGTGGPGVDPRTIYTLALGTALEMLGTKDCMAIFNANLKPGEGYAPRDVLAMMAYGGSTGNVPHGTSFGMIKKRQLPGNYAAVTVPDRRTEVSVGDGTSRAYTADIELQSDPLSAGFYGAQTVDDLALTIIHELGHAYNIVTQLGGSAIVYDADAMGKPIRHLQDQNSRTVKDACKP